MKLLQAPSDCLEGGLALGSKKIFLRLQNDLCNGAVPPNGRTAINLFGDPVLGLAQIHCVADLPKECSQPFPHFLG